MAATTAGQRGSARRACAAAALVLTTLATGCASGQAASGGQAAPTQSAAPATPAPSQLRAQAAAYMAIARPANRRLDTEVDGYADDARDDLTGAQADLRAEAATERWFDRRLLKIGFSPAIAAIARAMVQVNVRRIKLTERQAQSSSISELRSLESRHKAADAAVEADVRAIRRALGLPPPSTS